ncbi:MAG: anti-anti-sigma factor [Halioglobus sp.]|nr:anti-anti-sigma factor [Halioglobus sp.]
MTERMRESLSALLDDEANELEIQRVLAAVDGDTELRSAWTRYSLARDALDSQPLALAQVDISARVRAALAAETPEPARASGSGLRQRLLRPLASFAVAASVAATVVIGGQQLAPAGGDAGTDAVARLPAGPSAVSILNVAGATAVPASYGTQPLPVLAPADRTAYRELARSRMNRYMQLHAEHAALNTPQGLIPFARVPQIHE